MKQELSSKSAVRDDEDIFCKASEKGIEVKIYGAIKHDAIVYSGSDAARNALVEKHAKRFSIEVYEHTKQEDLGLNFINRPAPIFELTAERK